MANYRAGDMIRLTRKAVGLSQEELSDNICSVQTLSRIETGKVSVKREIYQQLMERMGRSGAKAYSALSVEEFELLDLMLKVGTAVYRHEYEEAEGYLQQLKAGLDISDVGINFQYVKRIETIIDFRLKRISKECFLQELEQVIGLTIPDYKELLDLVYPFTGEEVQLLMNIATAYHEFENYEMAVRIDGMLLRSLASGYMGVQNAVQLELLLTNNKAQEYGGLGEHEKAIALSRDAIQKAKANKMVTILPNCYTEIAWNMIEQIEEGERDRAELDICKRYLRQGYAAAAVSGQDVVKRCIRDYYEEYFKENIYLCSGWGQGEEVSN